MKLTGKCLAVLGCMLVLSGSAGAVQTSGTKITLSASSQITVPNDEAQVTFVVTAQNKDAAQAASAVNAQMKAGTQIVQASDKTAVIKTSGYTSYPVYTQGTDKKASQIDGWRVEQTLTVTTHALTHLPDLVADAQKVLAVSQIRFGLRPETQKQHDSELTQKAYQALEERINMVTQAMGRNSRDVVIESIQVDDDGGRINAPVMMRAMAMKQDSVATPQFESGESTLSMRLSSEVKLK